MRESIAFYMTAAYIYPQLPLMIAMVFWGDRFSFTLRIVTPLATQIACMILLPFVAPANVGGMWATLVIIFIIGLTTAIFQSSGFAYSRQVRLG